MNLQQKEKYYLLSDPCYKGFLLDLKRRYYSRYDIKILNKENLLDMLTYSMTEETIPYLLSLGKYDYSQIKKILSFIRTGNIKKGDPFFDIYEDLIQKNYLVKDDYGVLDLKQRTLLLFETEADIELVQLLKRNNITNYQSVSFNDFSITPFYPCSNDKDHPPFIVYDDKFHQYFDIFSDIRKRIKADESCKDNFQIVIADQKDLYFIKYFSNLFDIPCISDYKVPLLSKEGCKAILTSFYESVSFIIPTEFADTDIGKTVSSLIDDYRLKEIKDFKKAYASLIEILSQTKEKILFGDRGITITDQYHLNNKMTYLTCFQYDIFYKVFDDSHILPDNTLRQYDVNPSNVKTLLDKEKKLNHLKYQNILSASRVLLHLDEKIYDSQFLDEYNWSMMPKKKLETSGLLTSKAKRAALAFLRDENNDLPDCSAGYRTYSNKFSGSIPNANRKSYSPSQLKTYHSCPFKYYLDYILSLSNYDKVKDRLSSKRGVLIHKVLENLYLHPEYDLDFEKEYENRFELGYQAYLDECKKDKTPVTKEEEVYIEFIKKWLKDVVLALRQMTSKNGGHATITKELAEQSLSFTLSSKNGTPVTIRGQLDKLLVTEKTLTNDQGEQETYDYFTIIDYKTGKESFDYSEVFLGGSLQLPLYTLGIEDQRSLFSLSTETHFGGFGISHVYFSKPPLDTKEGMYNLKAIQINSNISGICLTDTNYLDSIDATSYYLNKKNNLTYVSSARFRSPRNGFTENHDYLEVNDSSFIYQYDQLFLDAESAALDMIDKIENSQFDIHPATTKRLDNKWKELPCRYCQYKDICYHSLEDEVSYFKTIKEHFFQLSDNDLLDEREGD